MLPPGFELEPELELPATEVVLALEPVLELELAAAEVVLPALELELVREFEPLLELEPWLEAELSEAEIKVEAELDEAEILPAPELALSPGLLAVVVCSGVPSVEEAHPTVSPESTVVRATVVCRYDVYMND